MPNHHSGLLLLLLSTLLVYVSGIGSGFQFDDIANIVFNGRLQVNEWSLTAMWQASQSSEAGPLRRPISMLSFWVNYYFSGLNPGAFQITNIVIHLLNGIALYWLCVLLARGHALACHEGEPPPHRTHIIALTAAALWLLHPLNLTGVLYIVQRMTSLSSFFMLLGAISYASARLQLMTGQSGWIKLIAGFSVFGLLAVFSKETGALLPLYLFAIEWALFRFSTARHLDRRRLWVFFGLIVLTPSVLFLGSLLTSPEWLLRGYSHRDFTLLERLLTESRALWLYLSWALLPDPSALALFHDDLEISRGWWQPWTTVPAVAGLVLLALSAILTVRRIPIYCFAVLWFLFGHVLESTVLPLELVFEHRNYLPLAGLTFAVAFGLHSFPRYVQPRLALWVSLALTISMAGALSVRAYQWSDPNLLAQKESEQHPGSARANFEAGMRLLYASKVHGDASQNLPQQLKISAFLEKSLTQNKEAIHGYYGLIALALKYGQPIEEKWLIAMAQRLRTGREDPLNALIALCELAIKTDSREPTQKQMVALFAAALENPNASDGKKAQLLFRLAQYFALAVKNDQQAVRLTIAATKYDPHSPSLRLSLAKLANQLGNLPYAKVQLEQARALDKMGRLRYEINKFGATLSAPQ